MGLFRLEKSKSLRVSLIRAEKGGRDERRAPRGNTVKIAI
jgi:hypothetical protein